MEKYTFKKSDGGPISKQLAESWIERYKSKHKEGPWAYFFGDDIIDKVKNHPEAVGMRIFLGYTEEGKLQMVLLGARADGSNIWPEDDGKDSNGGGTAGDNGAPCPPYCP